MDDGTVRGRAGRAAACSPSGRASAAAGVVLWYGGSGHAMADGHHLLDLSYGYRRTSAAVDLGEEAALDVGARLSFARERGDRRAVVDEPREAAAAEGAARAVAPIWRGMTGTTSTARSSPLSSAAVTRARTSTCAARAGAPQTARRRRAVVGRANARAAVSTVGKRRRRWAAAARRRRAGLPGGGARAAPERGGGGVALGTRRAGGGAPSARRALVARRAKATSTHAAAAMRATGWVPSISGSSRCSASPSRAPRRRRFWRRAPARGGRRRRRRRRPRRQRELDGGDASTAMAAARAEVAEQLRQQVVELVAPRREEARSRSSSVSTPPRGRAPRSTGAALVAGGRLEHEAEREDQARAAFPPCCSRCTPASRARPGRRRAASAAARTAAADQVVGDRVELLGLDVPRLLRR